MSKEFHQPWVCGYADEGADLQSSFGAVKLPLYTFTLMEGFPNCNMVSKY
jgi:hypothetical protein